MFSLGNERYLALIETSDAVLGTDISRAVSQRVGGDRKVVCETGYDPAQNDRQVT